MFTNNIPALLMATFGCLSVLAGILEVRSLLAASKAAKLPLAPIEEHPEQDVKGPTVPTAPTAHSDLIHIISELTRDVAPQEAAERMEKIERVFTAIAEISKNTEVLISAQTKAVAQLNAESEQVRVRIEARNRKIRPGFLATKASAAHLAVKPSKKVPHPQDDSVHQPA